MSYFLFGAFRLADEASEGLDKFTWQIVNAGNELQLYVLVGPNMLVQPVRDILREQNLLTSKDVPFLLTASPNRDNSFELVSPYQVEGGNLQPVYESICRVVEWLDRVSILKHVQGIYLIVSEGYDNSFTEIISSATGLVNKIINIIEREGEVPSLLIKLDMSFKNSG